MEPKKIIALIIVVLVLVAGGVLLFNNYFQLKSGDGIKNIFSEKGKSESETSLTRTEVPENTKIPEAGEQTNEDIAAPVSVSTAAPGVSAKLRTFNIEANGGEYQPSTVIVKVGDTVHINFKAIDKKYDITFPDYGMKQIADKGEIKVLEFQAVSEGKFTYYCDICGGLDSKAIGYIIVAP